MSRHPVDGRVVAITGAASGIGRALAVEFDRRGARLALSDVDAAGLAGTAGLLSGSAHTALVEVSDGAAVHAWAARVADHFGAVHLVVNNAGVATALPVLESSWEVYERVLAVNLAGVVHGTQAFLPHLIASGDGAVVNVSSINGIFVQPGMSQYCTSKFAVRGFTEALRAEMLMAGHPVRVSVVHPGGVATPIAANALRLAESVGHEPSAAERHRQRVYQDRLLTLPASAAARIVVDGVERGRPRILVGRDAVAMDLLVRAAPALAVRLGVAAERRLFPGDRSRGRSALR